MKKFFSTVASGLIGWYICGGILSSPNLLAATDAAVAQAAPKIKFATNFFDFGKITATETIAGEFEFTNVGNGILKVEPPESSCDCTTPIVKPDALAPGETGKIIYAIKLDRPLNGQRHIRVHSNDPETPVVDLTMQMDYTPLYELNPKSLKLTLPAGKDEVRANFTISRIDGKPLGIDRVTGSPGWLSAALEPAFKQEDNSARISIIVRRPPGPPSLITAKVELWSPGQAAHPVQTMPVTGEVFGELSAVPARIYWVIPDFGKNKSDYPAEALTRKIQLISVLGHEVEITNAVSNIKGMNVQILPKGDKKRFDLILKFDELPQTFINSKIRLETSLASLPVMEVPLIVSVPNEGAPSAEAEKPTGKAATTHD